MGSELDVRVTSVLRVSYTAYTRARARAHMESGEVNPPDLSNPRMIHLEEAPNRHAALFSGLLHLHGRGGPV
jgi:hypothetical protein